MWDLQQLESSQAAPPPGSVTVAALAPADAEAGGRLVSAAAGDAILGYVRATLKSALKEQPPEAPLAIDRVQVGAGAGNASHGWGQGGGGHVSRLTAAAGHHRTAVGNSTMAAGPCTLHPAPRTPHPAPRTPHPAPRTPHPAPCTLHPAPCTLHPAPRTLQPPPPLLCPPSPPGAPAAQAARLFGGMVEFGAFVRALEARCGTRGLAVGPSSAELVAQADELSEEELQ